MTQPPPHIPRPAEPPRSVARSSEPSSMRSEMELKPCPSCGRHSLVGDSSSRDRAQSTGVVLDVAALSRVIHAAHKSSHYPWWHIDAEYCRVAQHIAEAVVGHLSRTPLIEGDRSRDAINNSPNDQAKSLVERLRERRKIMWNAPVKDGGFAKLVAPEDLDEAIHALQSAEHQLDLLRAELDAVYQDRARDTIKASEQIVRLVADLKRKEEALRGVIAWKDAITLVAPELGGLLRAIYEAEASLSSEPTDGK